MLLCGRLFLINCLIFSLVSSSSSSSSPNATRPRSGPSGGMSEDYDIYDEITTTTLPPFTTSEAPELNPCDYDMCVEQQQTCQEIAAAARCLCPGLTSVYELPSAPHLSSLTQKGDRGVEVNWCAPTSIVTHYNVSVKDKDKVMHVKVEERKRMIALKNVAAGVLVCVKAVNIAGTSAENNQSCKKFEPQHSDSELALKLGIIGGVVGVTLLVILGLLLWRHKTRQKSAARPETEGVL